MNEEQLNDLKQFIAATVSQATADTAAKDDIANMATKDGLAQLELRLAEQIEDPDSKVDTSAVTLNEQVNNHRSRITKLEQQAA